MPRTERDFDVLATAVEKHAGHGQRIGKLLNEEKIGPEEALNQAADADEKLYNTLDTLFMAREEERQAEIDAEDS